MRTTHLADLEALRTEIKHERQKKRALEQSIAELEKACELYNQEPDRPDEFPETNDQSDEWRTRYETQMEFNGRLADQIAELKEKIAQKKGELKRIAKGEGLPSLTKTDVKKLLIQLQRQKNSLESQMRDYEWRIDKEAQLYHKANEKRKAIYFDIKRNREQAGGPSSSGGSCPKTGPAGEIRRGSLLKGSYVRKLAARRSSAVLSQPGHLRIGKPVSNIAENHRILDPSKGPIRKTSTVRKLPTLGTGASSSPRQQPTANHFDLKTEGTVIKNS